MKTNNCLLTLSVFLLASCQPPTGGAPSAGEVPAAANAIAGPVAAEVAKKKKIKPATYRVCQDAGESGHGKVVGPHLVVDQNVEIGPFDESTGAAKVCLRKKCPAEGENPPESEVKVMWLGGDEYRLGGEGTFDHKYENGQQDVLTHFVQIFDDPDDHGDAQFCKKDNVLTINFCTRDNSGKLNCVGDGPHLGHIHVEN
jgi:hypothetical protein